MLYRVTWSIDVDADSPREAAELAEAAQASQISREGSLGGVFEVEIGDEEVVLIDLHNERMKP